MTGQRRHRPAVPPLVPVQVCGKCQFSETATMEFKPRRDRATRFARLSGRSELERHTAWSSDHCPRCGAELVRQCESEDCDGEIWAADDRHCRKCGAMYRWALLRGDEEINWRTAGKMFGKVGSLQVWIVDGDLTRLVSVDAVVIGDRPDGAMTSELGTRLKEEWGPEIEDESRTEADKLGGDEGAAWTTSSGTYRSVRHVIHCAAMSSDDESSEDLVRVAAANALREASRLRLNTIAFPALATGAAELEVPACGRALAHAMLDHVEAGEASSLSDVVFVLFGTGASKAFLGGFRHALESRQPHSDVRLRENSKT